MKELKKIMIIGMAVSNIALAYSQGFGDINTISEDWKFHLGDIKYGGAEFLDHSSWRKLDVPHDWSVELQASPELASCTGYLPGGIGWYRKDLEINAGMKDKKVYVYFEGVYNNSEVFINGKWIGKRPNGYISFMYDLTPYINFGGRNVIAVKVDHTDYADSRWYTGSGIYRDVHIVTANPVHINLWGVSYQTEVGSGSASMQISTEINNTTDSRNNVRVVHSLYDQSDKVVARQKVSKSVDNMSVEDIACRMQIASPKLWSLEDPYLYTLKTEVYDGNALIDETTTKVGIRKTDFDAQKGFSLNDKPIKLKGVCIHHDAGCLGAAVPKDVWRRRLLQLKAIGCNAIRMSHNPQASAVYEICDEIGLLVKDEAFDEWEYPKKKWIEGWNVGTPGFQGSSHYFREWNKRDLADMIRRDRNHPSIIMWSIGNEVDYPNDPYSHPILNEASIGQQHEKGFQTSQPHANRLGEIARELVTEAKKWDTSRPVTAALAGAVMSNETAYPAVLDIVGYNYTEDRYDQDHKAYPQRVLYGSETRHDMNAWKSARDNDFIMGQFIWTGFDYLGEAGPWPSRGFTTGMIDLAGNIKPNGYFRRSLWMEQPVAYIGTYTLRNKDDISTWAPSVWNYEQGETIRVVGYTNCSSAELLLNGKVVGKKKKYDDNTGVIYWDVPFSAGTLELKGYDNDKLMVTEVLKTSSHPSRIICEAVVPEKIGKGSVVHYELSVVDENGTLVSLADNQITCSIEGAATLLGLESGDGDARDNYRDNIQRCRNGKLLAYVKANNNTGNVKVTFTSPMLKQCSVEFKY